MKYKNDSDEIMIHKSCGGEAIELYGAEISYCTECESVCEGDTKYISIKEFETAQDAVQSGDVAVISFI